MIFLKKFKKSFKVTDKEIKRVYNLIVKIGYINLLYEN